MSNEEPNVVVLAKRMVLAVDAFIAELNRLGLVIDGNEIWALQTVPRDLLERVFVTVCGEHQAGTNLSVRVPTAELHRWREVLPDHIVAQFGCSRDDALMFLAWADDHELIPNIQCNHPGCRMRRPCAPPDIMPSDVATIIKRASSELWYCHHHDRVALHRDGVVSDHIADTLTRMQDAPGSNSTQLGITKIIGKFLESENLATRRVNGRGVGAMYHWTIADLGVQILSKRTALG